MLNGTTGLVEANQNNQVRNVAFHNDSYGVVIFSASIALVEHCQFDGGSVGIFDFGSLGGDRVQSCNFRNQIASQASPNGGIAMIGAGGNGMLVEDCLFSKGSNAGSMLLTGPKDKYRFDSFVGGGIHVGGTDEGAGSN